MKCPNCKTRMSTSQDFRMCPKCNKTEVRVPGSHIWATVVNGAPKVDSHLIPVNEIIPKVLRKLSRHLKTERQVCEKCTYFETCPTGTGCVLHLNWETCEGPYDGSIEEPIDNGIL